MSLLEVWLAGYGVIFVMMTLIWIISVVITNVSIIDIFWGFGFVVLAWTYYLLTDGDPQRKIIIVALVTIWGVRLTFYLAKRNIGKEEDYRYQQFRKKYGEGSYWWKSFFQSFMLQGTLMVIIAVPLLAGQYASQPDTLTIFDGLGIVVWLIGFTFESIGDWQLSRFKANPDNKGKVFRSGLWKYTRHPNYFGDAMVWWGYFLIAVSTSFGFLSFFGPLIMTFFLLRVSGVALLEQSLKENKPGYEEYVRCTSAFLPMPPKC